MSDIEHTINIADHSDAHIWNSHISHPLQSWEWGEFRKKMGIDVVRLILKKTTVISQCWEVTFHPIPFTPFTIGYFPKGPTPDSHMIKELIKLGKQKNALFIQLEPNIENNSNFDLSTYTRIAHLKPAHHPLFTKYTFILDLTKSEEELLKNMHNKTRYNIRLAQKHGVVIKEDSSDTAFMAYLQLSEETTQRQGFYAHNRTYHQTMWNSLKQNGVAKLFTATYNNEILTAWIIFCLNDTIYYPYGASSRNHREVMAPNLMLWELIRWGKKHGFQKFDLWGAIGPNPDIHDSWYGFHRFKEGYNPTLIEYKGSYDLIIHPFLYTLYCISNTIRWKLLNIKHHFKLFQH